MFFFVFFGGFFIANPAFRTSRKNNLKNHQLAVHEGEVYSCHQCAFSATWKSTLKRHVASKHELMRFGARAATLPRRAGSICAPMRRPCIRADTLPAISVISR